MKHAVKKDEKHSSVLSDLNPLVRGILATCFGTPEVTKKEEEE